MVSTSYFVVAAAASSESVACTASSHELTGTGDNFNIFQKDYKLTIAVKIFKVKGKRNLFSIRVLPRH